MRGGTLTCPICRARSLPNQIFDDKRLKREILSLKINCDQSGKGCNWSGELRQREQHNEECGYASKPCVNGCRQVVMRKDMENHKTNDCLRRIVACEHCGAAGKYGLLRRHYLQCGKYPVHCVYGCGVVVAREEMKEHTSLQGTCPNSPLACEFHDIGCEFSGKRHELNEHIETSSTGHFRLFLTEMRGMKRKLADVEQELSEESEQRKLVMPTGQFIYMWKIDKWQQKVEAEGRIEASIDSKTFCVDPGYHMFITAYPCGEDADSDGDGDHLGLFLCPTKGDFDAHVNWPFTKPFTFSIVDQQLEGRNISATASPPFNNRLGDPSLAGPTDVGFGWSQFTSHERLRTRCYIKDDTVLIQLSVTL